MKIINVIDLLLVDTGEKNVSIVAQFSFLLKKRMSDMLITVGSLCLKDVVTC